MLITVFHTIFLIVIAAVAELKESMIMLQDGDRADNEPGNGVGGVKAHILYGHIYHYINAATHIAAFVCGIFFLNVWPHINYAFGIPYLLGMICLMCQAAEMSYSYGRYKVWIPDYENFWAGQHINYIIKGKYKVILLYFFRSLIGVTLLILSLIQS